MARHPRAGEPAAADPPEERAARGPRVIHGARPRAPREPRPGGPGRWRAATLAAVYLAMAAHIIHWKVAGRTLAPLELNEVMHTLELGVITAGFIFMCAALLSVLVCGRFFCSWGCHILALEDLCAWLLRKLGIRPRPLRSRLLLWIPPIAFSYMFIWPQIARWMVHRWPAAVGWVGPRPDFELRIARDGEGWASFVTSDYWRNLPTWPIAALTFAVCGFAIVFLLGSRSFCRYACPYGFAFSLADRAAPGRIKLKGTCVQCAACTAACTSGIRVHEEIARFGRVVTPACLKDLDCVHACPEGAIGFGFARPGGFASLGRERVRQRYDFSLSEELLMAALVLLTIPIYRGLYDRIPFLLTLALGSIHGYLAVVGIRLIRKPDVSLGGLALARQGSITAAGRTFALAAAAVFALFVHSGVVRGHERLGVRGYERVKERWSRNEASPPESIARAREHLERRLEWGWFGSLSLERMLADLDWHEGRAEASEARLARILAADPDDAWSRLRRARLRALRGEAALATSDLAPLVGDEPVDRRVRAEARHLLASLHLIAGEAAAAERELERAIEESPEFVVGYSALAELLALRGELARAEALLRAAIAAAPEWPEAHRQLGLLLHARGLPAEGLAELRAAIELSPGEPSLRVDLGRALAGAGDLAGAEAAFRDALASDPEFAPAHLCLEALLRETGRPKEARFHRERLQGAN